MHQMRLWQAEPQPEAGRGHAEAKRDHLMAACTGGSRDGPDPKRLGHDLLRAERCLPWGFPGTNPNPCPFFGWGN